MSHYTPPPPNQQLNTPGLCFEYPHSSIELIVYPDHLMGGGLGEGGGGGAMRGGADSSMIDLYDDKPDVYTPHI